MEIKQENNVKNNHFFYQSSLRYSRLLFVQTLVGSLFFIIVFFLVLVCMAIVMGIFKIDPRPKNDIEIWILMISLGCFLLFFSNRFSKLYNKIFSKKISIIEVDKNHFELWINEEKYLCKKKDIVKVRYLKRIGQARLISEEMLVLKIAERTFRFSSSNLNLTRLESVSKQLEQWK